MGNIILSGHTVISGTHGGGKTSTVEEIEKRIRQEKHIVTYDQARHYLKEKNWHSDTINDVQRVELQLNTLARYIGALIHATRTRLNALMDGSLIEVKAYSQGVLSQNYMDAIDKRLSEYKYSVVAYVLPPTIPLVDDGLRFTNKEFRIEIHQRIMRIIQEHDIPYHLITSQSIEDRAEEIISLSLNRL